MSRVNWGQTGHRLKPDIVKYSWITFLLFAFFKIWEDKTIEKNFLCQNMLVDDEKKDAFKIISFFSVIDEKNKFFFCHVGFRSGKIVCRKIKVCVPLDAEFWDNFNGVSCFEKDWFWDKLLPKNWKHTFCLKTGHQNNNKLINFPIEKTITIIFTCFAYQHIRRTFYNH